MITSKGAGDFEQSHASALPICEAGESSRVSNESSEEPGGKIGPSPQRGRTVSAAGVGQFTEPSTRDRPPKRIDDDARIRRGSSIVKRLA
jgi:hypothetical protein